MSTANKLTYLNTTKQKLKQAINNIGGEVTDETTFREYVNQLENAYDNLPKTEYQEGTEVNLGKTLKGKLDFDNGVVGIGQSSQKTTTGKNKFAITVSLPITQNGITLSRDDNDNIILNGTPTISSGSISFQVASNVIVNAGTYTMSIDNKMAGVGVTYSDTTPAGALNLTLADTVNKRTATISAVNYGNFAINVRYDVGKLTNFIVNPQLESGSSATDYEQYTGGQASPNPSYPQEIKCVAGRNILKDSGWERKTAWNETQIQDSTTRIMSDYIEVDEHLNYYATIQSTSYCFGNVVLYNASKVQFATYYNAVSQVINGTRSIGLKFPTNTKYARFVVRNTDNTSEVTLDELAVIKPQLEKGTTSTPYLPYNTIEEVVSGKNLVSGVEHGKYSDVTGNKLDDNTLYRNIEPILIKPNTTYTFSINGTAQGINKFFYDSNMNFIEKANDTDATFTTPSNAYYLNIYRGTSLGNTGWQLEQGSTATTYEPYITPTSYQLSLGDIELCGIGDYKDYIYKSGEKWYVHKEIGKYVFTGSENNWASDTTWGSNSYRVPRNAISSNIKAWSEMFCNYFKSYSTSTIKTLNNEIVVGSSNLVINNQNTPTLSEFTTWLTRNTTIVYFQLNTPTETEITDTTLINQVKALYNAHSNNGTTIITSNGNLPMIIKVRGLKGGE